MHLAVPASLYPVSSTYITTDDAFRRLHDVVCLVPKTLDVKDFKKVRVAIHFQVLRVDGSRLHVGWMETLESGKRQATGLVSDLMNHEDLVTDGLNGDDLVRQTFYDTAKHIIDNSVDFTNQFNEPVLPEDAIVSLYFDKLVTDRREVTLVFQATVTEDVKFDSGVDYLEYDFCGNEIGFNKYITTSLTGRKAAPKAVKA
jgi:hypothetical protein